MNERSISGSSRKDSGTAGTRIRLMNDDDSLALDETFWTDAQRKIGFRYAWIMMRHVV